MAEILNPNQILAKDIVDTLVANGIVLDQNASGIADYLADGKMKDSVWKKAFENKITALSLPDEAQTTVSQ